MRADIWFGLVGLALIAVAAGSVVVIGLVLPERCEGRSEIVYESNDEDVWDALLDYDQHPMTGRMKRGVEATPAENNLPVWVEDMGNGELITVKTVLADRPRHGP
jgi:hypothetical protein